MIPCFSDRAISAGTASAGLTLALALLLTLPAQALWAAPGDEKLGGTTQGGAENCYINLSRIDSAAWKRAIDRASQHLALQAGHGQFTLIRVFLGGVEPVVEINPRRIEARKTRQERTRRPPRKPSRRPEAVNGVTLFFDAVRLLLPTRPESNPQPGISRDASEIQVSSVKLVGIKELSGGGMYRELRNGEFVLVEHINSTRNDGRDPVSLGSYTHRQATIDVAVPSRGQLGIAGDVVLVRPEKNELGRIVAQFRFANNEPVIVTTLKLGPLVVGGPYGRTYKFNNDGVCETGLLPPGTYEILLPDFDIIKSRWTVRVEAGRTTRLQFTARSQKVVEKSREETIPR